MNKYRCPACGGEQYTSCDTAQGCIYCGHHGIELITALDPEEAFCDFVESNADAEFERQAARKARG